MEYDKNNIFAKILRGEIPNDTVYEDEYCLAFNDLYPKSEVHIVAIPKGEYINFAHFNSNASDIEISNFFKAISNIIREKNIELGCQILSNCGEKGGQEIPHFHMHILSGNKIKLD
ncbi:MAG: HIT domain-containing protein [Alphaproteobacteria bacterium]|nr:HIT domain-containing protein [Alphaproteobacteria bacterium]